MNRKKVAVAPDREFQARRRLFSLLSELYPVDFELWRGDRAITIDGAILWAGCAEEDDLAAAARGGCLVVAAPAAPAIPIGGRRVKFGRTATLDNCFLGQTMIEEVMESAPLLRPQDGDEVIASLDDQPYWLVRRQERTMVDIVALPPEEMAEGETVYHHFNRRRWLQLLPFLHFLKRLTAEEAWTPPPLRACLMFDDPNLHWPTYGFLDFRELAQHARECNYHVACAMVPLNAGFAHRGAAAIFRENPQRLSLCMHGNNHAPAELAAPLDQMGFTKLFSQGLTRIEDFERRCGVPVSRVMVPPNGAFRAAGADPMLNLGYEALCVSRSSLTSWNKEESWPPAFGHAVTEFLGGGLPVIPRQVMAAGHEGTYRLAAFLNQPIIPHAHHQDCRDGLDLLARTAGSINGIGNITWMDMASIGRTNYLKRQTGDSLAVKMLSRRIMLPVDGHVKEIRVERPWIFEVEGEAPLILRNAESILASGKFGRRCPAMPVSASGLVELISPAPAAMDYRAVESPRPKLWNMARRVLAEARDRALPLTSSLRRKKEIPAKAATFQNPTGRT